MDFNLLKKIKKVVQDSCNCDDIKLMFLTLKINRCNILEYCYILDMEQTIREPSFYISKYPVSDCFIKQFIEKKEQPLSYYDYEDFISKLNDATGIQFLIPKVEQGEFGVQSIHTKTNICQGLLYDKSGNIGELYRSSEMNSDVCYIKDGTYKSVLNRLQTDYTDVKFKHIPLKNVGIRLCLEVE